MTAAHQPWHSDPWFATWLRLARRAALLLACVWSVSGASYYVATSGSAVNPGTLASPWSLQYALTNATVAAGDTVYVRGGTYAPYASVVSTLTGTAINPIIVTRYGSESPVFDGVNINTNSYVFTIQGAYTHYKNFEVTDSNATRPSGSDDPNTFRPAGFYFEGTNCKLINLVVHDLGNGILFATTATGSEVYGCLSYNNGWNDAPYGRGHGIYAQSTASHTMTDNILCNNYGLGIQCYTELGVLNGITVDGNISFHNGVLNSPSYPRHNILVGGLTSATNITVRSNYTYHATGAEAYIGAAIGFTPFVENANVSFLNNYIAGGIFQALRWTNITLTGNTFSLCTVTMTPSAGMTSPTWNNNVYNQTATWKFTYDGTSYQTLGAWQGATGFDASSTLNGAPSATVYFVHPNAYETGRGHVAVYNWAGSDNVSVDLSSVCQGGRSYAVKNAANYYGPTVKTFAYASSLVSLPMTNLTVATPVGGSAPSATGPTFNAFIIEPTATIKTRGFLRKR